MKRDMGPTNRLTRFSDAREAELANKRARTVAMIGMLSLVTGTCLLGALAALHHWADDIVRAGGKGVWPGHLARATLNFVPYAVSESAAKESLEAALFDRRDYAFAKILIERLAPEKPRERVGLLSMQRAFEEGRVDVVRFLIEQGVELNSRENPTGQTALNEYFMEYLALHPREGGYPREREPFHSDVLELLIAAGADVNLPSKVGRLPLADAVLCDSISWGPAPSTPPWSRARRMLQAGADPLRLHSSGEVSLLIALLNHGLDSEFLDCLDRGADHSARHAGWPLPILALDKGFVRCYDELLLRGYDYARATAEDTSPYQWAVRYRSPGALQYFLERGANPNELDRHGCAPLERALKWRATDAANVLLRHGADADAIGLDGEPLLFLAMRSAEPDKLVALLLGAGADPEARRPSDGRTSLDFAVELANSSSTSDYPVHQARALVPSLIRDAIARRSPDLRASNMTEADSPASP